MSHAYNPGLLVSEWQPLRRARLLPIDGEVLVQPGQRLAPDDIVAETVMRGSVVPVNVAGSLGINPDEVPAALLKPIGAPVSEGEVLAATKGVFGLFRAECRSPAAGTVLSVSPATGQVMIEGPATTVRVSAFVAGTVAEVRPCRGAVIATGAAYIQGIFGVGGERHGPVVLAVSSPVETLTEREIAPTFQGRVVIGGALVTLGALRAAVQAGVAAVISGGIHAHDLRDFMGEEMGAAVTGSENLGLTLILTEGFGEIAMARRTFRLLGEREGFTASVTGATQIRAGAVRPEIIIPAAGGGAGGAAAAVDAGIAVGSVVRIIREPHFGALGVVTALPAEPQRVESGARVRVLVVELESGVRYTLPRSNVEVF